MQIIRTDEQGRERIVGTTQADPNDPRTGKSFQLNNIPDQDLAKALEAESGVRADLWQTVSAPVPAWVKIAEGVLDGGKASRYLHGLISRMDPELRGEILSDTEANVDGIEEDDLAIWWRDHQEQ